ncbi:MAG: hypothetical protein C0617_11870 [Desulfuromonas sp.]|uniref:STAS domain-containing protein n=1 Tax=Desulfuromonas sp. TaxID=892 RepID=UPI000CB1C223|nr:STAS domain-containing protein [Desulfuromonas sp.]PLX83227.1 MAG: hypothetical protein C0617_11870 [Desulfuromonas sp.]
MNGMLQTRVGMTTYLTPAGAIGEAGEMAALKQAVEEHLRLHQGNLVLDLGRTPSVQSAALESLLDIHDELARAGGSLQVTNANALLRDIFLVSGFSDYVEVSD